MLSLPSNISQSLSLSVRICILPPLLLIEASTELMKRCEFWYSWWSFSLRLKRHMLCLSSPPSSYATALMGPYGPIWPRNIRNLLRWGGWRDTSLNSFWSCRHLEVSSMVNSGTKKETKCNRRVTQPNKSFCIATPPKRNACLCSYPFAC